MGHPDYAAVGIYRSGQARPSLLSANGKVIVFDTPQMARHVLPLLGGGRIAAWDADKETVCFTPIDPQGVNRACILTGYDPYHLPAGLPLRSETRLRAWRNHVMWQHVFADCGQMRRRVDGTFANTALGEN